MKDAGQDGQEGLGYLGKVFAGNVAVVELAIVEAVIDIFLKNLLKLFSGYVPFAAGGCLDAIGQHDQGRFNRLRPWSRIAEFCVGDWTWARCNALR